MGNFSRTVGPAELFEATLLAQVREAVIAADEGLRVTHHWNRAAEEMFSPSGETTLGWPLGELFQAEGVTDRMMGEDYTGELLCRRRDGAVFEAEVRSTPLRNPGGRAQGVVVSMHEMGRTLAALRKSEELLRLAQTAAMVGIWEWDPATQALSWTPELEILYGYPPGGIRTYADWSSRVNRNDLRRVEDERTRAVLQHRPFDVEFRIEQPQGAMRWLKARGGAIYDERGRPSRVFGITLDVTERKRLKEALAEAGRKDEFLAMLSHELRNPLTPIQNSLAILERAAPGGEQAMRAQAVIGRQVGHLTRLVDDLLDVTRLARGKVQLRQERFELGEVVGRTVEDYRAAFANGGVVLVSTICQEPMPILGDATRIAQVVGNLLANAAKFTPRGGRVELTLRRDGETAALRVRDDGPGIDPGVLEHVFEPFVQASQASDRKSGGLGLGLALVKGLVELHGGSVSRLERQRRGRRRVHRAPAARGIAGGGRRSARARRFESIAAGFSLSRTTPMRPTRWAKCSSYAGMRFESPGTGPEGLTVARAFRPGMSSSATSASRGGTDSRWRKLSVPTTDFSGRSPRCADWLFATGGPASLGRGGASLITSGSRRTSMS